MTHSGGADVAALHDVADVLSDAVFSTDRQGRIVCWNRTAEKLLGYGKEEAIGKELARICPPASAEEQSLFENSVAFRGGVCHLRTHRFSKQGRRIAGVLSALPFLDKRGTVAGLTYVFKPIMESSTIQALRDVSDLKRREGDSFRAFTDAVADMLWAADASGGGTYLGMRFAQYMGRDVDELRPPNWLSQIVHPDDRGRVDIAWSAALRDGQRFEAEARLRRFDGVYRWFVVRAVPVLTDGGQIAEWVGSCTDINDLKRSQQTLLRSNKELKQFAYAAAHDLQEPLRNVATSVGMLRRQFSGELNPAAAQWIDASIEGAQRLHAMVKDLLAFTTIIDDAQQVAGRCSMTQALAKALKKLSHAIETTGARIESGELPELLIDEDHGVQILQSLIDNSLKYRHRNRTPVVCISATPDDSGWVITVRDNGIGFDRAYAGLIFGVFKRLHERSAYGGNGIGLAICERIVAHYGGRIWAEGWPGEGAAFHFTVPGCIA